MTIQPQRYRIDVSYDGTDYAGWQIQPNGMTVQQRIEEALGETIIVEAGAGTGKTQVKRHWR